MSQSQLPKEAFSFETLSNFKAEKTIDEITNKVVVRHTEGIKYVSQYFYTTAEGNHLLWTGSDFKIYDTAKIRELYFARMHKSILNWYFTENTNIYNFDTNTHKPRIYGHNINGFKGFMHKKTKKYNDYDAETKAGVETFLTYMNDVLASNNKTVLEYILKWLANMAQGNKNSSALYLKSVEGTGKSTFTEFIKKYVLGDNITVKSNADPLRTSNNKVLFGALFCIFEELPTFSSHDWEGISSRLKDMITGDEMMFSEKYEKAFTAKNFNNYIINTNVESIKSSEGRRYFILDISTSRKGDHKYFDVLYKTCFNEKVGEAFYAYLSSIDVSKFNAQGNMPETNRKADAIAERLDMVYRFLKWEFILPKKNLKMKLSEAYGLYLGYCIEHDKKPLSNIAFSGKLKEVSINYRKSNGMNILDYKYEQLQEIANNNKWIHELDEYAPANVEETSNSDELNIAEINELKCKNASLEEQLKAMQDEINSLKSKHVKPTKPKRISETMQEETKPAPIPSPWGKHANPTKPKRISKVIVHDPSEDDTEDEEETISVSNQAQNAIDMLFSKSK